MPAPTCLILDFGGVLTTDLWESIRGCARREGLAGDAFLDLLKHDPRVRALYLGAERGEVAQADFERGLAEAAGLSPQGLFARLCTDLRPDETMLTYVARLRATGVRVGILSNSWGAGYFDPYDGYDLDDRADAVVISDHVGMRKPEPGIFTLMVDKLGVPAHECVFVDDMAANLPPAQALGMQVVHHTAAPATIEALTGLFAAFL